MKSEDKFFIIVLFILFFALLIYTIMRVDSLEQQVSNFSYNVSYGGQNMSIQDALERAGEGLTVDQWQEVQAMIDNAMNESR